MIKLRDKNDPEQFIMFSRAGRISGNELKFRERMLSNKNSKSLI